MLPEGSARSRGAFNALFCRQSLRATSHRHDREPQGRWRSRSSQTQKKVSRDLPAMASARRSSFAGLGGSRQAFGGDGYFPRVGEGHESEPPAGARESRPSGAARAAVALVAGYKRFLSPFLPRACRFSPSCSEYARLAILKYGFLGGAWRALGRLLRCHPFHPGGVDLP